MISLLFSINLISYFLPSHPGVKCDEPPKWVKEVYPADTEEIHSSQMNKQCLLLDTQINLETAESYYRIVNKVLPDGAEFSKTIEIEFDPSYETITLNKLEIFRNGEKIIPYLDGNIHLLQRELELEYNIYNGLVSLHFILPDIRGGDVLDIAYTKSGKNPIFENYFSDTCFLSYINRLEKYHFRILHPKNALQFKGFNTSQLFETKHLKDTLDETSVLLCPTEIYELDSNTPYFYMPCQKAQLSNIDSWQEISKWAKKLFKVEKIDLSEITKPWIHKTKEEQILAALHFVQNEISYMGIEGSIYSYQPRAPALTLSRRYGDCKDKTLLLKSLLNEMQIDSTPAFVNTNFMEGIHNWLPSLHAFNHVILQVPLQGELYWLDPTRKYQGGSLKDCSENYYGCYLLLNGGDDCLVNIPQDWGKNILQIDSHFAIDKKTLRVVTQASHMAADYYRSLLANEGKEAISKYFQEYYANFYGSAQASRPLKIQDNLQKNIITIVENYLLPDLFNDTPQLSFKSHILGHLPEKVPLSRKSPLNVMYPNTIKETFRLTSDEELSFAMSEKTFEHPSFLVKSKMEMENNALVINYFYNAKAAFIQPSDFKALRKILPEITDELYQIISFNTTIMQADTLSLWPVIALFLCVILFMAYKTMQKLPLTELSSDKIKQKWRKAFWIYFGHLAIGFILILIASIWLKNLPLLFTFIGGLVLNSIWATALYNKCYKKNGTKLLGVSIFFFLLPNFFNPFSLYFLFRSIKLFRYNKTLRREIIMNHCA